MRFQISADVICNRGFRHTHGRMRPPHHQNSGCCVRHEPHSMHIWRYSVKAIYLKGFGEPELLELRELPGPDIRPHDLIVAVRAAGVNRADLSHRKGAYQPDSAQNFSRNARVIRFSLLRRSGLHPWTTDPGAPVFPPGGVTPPGPAKYGTFAARWLYSRR